MNIETETTITERLSEIERVNSITFAFDYESNTIEAEGDEPDVKAALALLQPRAAFAEAIKARQPPPKPKRVRVRLAAEVPSLAVQKQNYVKWFNNKSQYYHPTQEQLDKMFAACEEGWEILPDFAHSFSVRRPDGSLASVNRKGQIVEPSIYSPHLPKPVEDEA